jgi:type I restriction enzyme S subunit
MTNGYPVYRLGDVASVQGGFAFKSGDFTELGVPVLKIKNVRWGEVDMAEYDCVDKSVAEKSARYFCKTGDLLISMTGSGPQAPNSVVGRVARFTGQSDKYLINQRVGRFVNKAPDKLDQRYLYYILARRETLWKLVSVATGSANQANISGSQIESLEIPLPSLSEQKVIANMLGVLDDKIELNRRMMATLESTARAFFQSWFVDFDPVRAKLNGHQPSGMDAATAALFPDSLTHYVDVVCPTGWKISPVVEDIGLVRGIEPGRDACNSEGIGRRFIRVGDVTGKRESDLFTNVVTEVDVKVGEILVSFDGTPGAISYSSEGVFSSGLRKLEGLKTQFHPCYLWCLARSDEFQSTIKEYAIGTTILHASASIPHLRRTVASAQVMQAFTAIVDPIWQQLINIHFESRNLANLRDTLLPKLLSGGLSLKEAA